MTTWRFIDAEKANHSVVRLCSALSVSRAAWYAWKQAMVSKRELENRRLAVHLKATHRASRGCRPPLYEDRQNAPYATN